MACAGAVGLLAGIGLGAVSSPPAGAQSPGTAPIAGTASPVAGTSPAEGRLAAGTRVSFELVLGPRDLVGAQALASAVSTPGSASYRHYLTPAQWESRFSPTVGQVAQATAWLRSQGLRVGSVSADRLAIDVTGTSAKVQRAFHTTLGYHLVNGSRLQLAEQDLSVPPTLAGSVVGVLGLNQSPATPDDTGGAPASVAGVVGSSARRPIRPPAGVRSAPPCGAFYGQRFDTSDPPYGQGYRYPLPDVVCGYTPAQLREAYGVAGLVAAGTNGTGQTVAVIDAYASPTLLTDAQQYANGNDPGHPLSASQFTEVVAHSFNDSARCQASGWFGEQTLDVEAVHAMAPGAKIVYVGAKNCFAALYGSLRTVVDDHLADVVTDSWGDNGGDVLDDTGTRKAVDDTLVMAAGTGVSVLFSSGDNGDEFSAVGVDAPDYPPSSPWVTAVGGTTLQIGFGVGQLGWSVATSHLCTQVLVGSTGCSSATLDTWLPSSFDEGSGGGTSYHYAQPAYQAGVVPAAMATRNAPEVGPTPMRVEPDVAMDGDPDTGILVGETQTFPNGTYYDQYRAGGTSLSSPLFAGLVALADQSAGKSLGFLNPALYKLPSAHPGALSDVVPDGLQGQIRVDFANQVDASGGFVTSTEILGYEGPETYCSPTGACATRDVVLSTGRGYDDMTGLGAPGIGFVAAMSAR